MDDGIETQSGMAASLVISTALFAVANGIPMERITAETGLIMADCMDPDRRLPSAIVPGIWRLLLEAHPDRALPLEMAEAAPFTLLGALAHGAQFARTSARRWRALFAFVVWRWARSSFERCSGCPQPSSA